MVLKRVMKVILWLILAVLVIVGGYAIYVYSSYYRLPDNLKLTSHNHSQRVLKPGQTYKAMTYNIGYGSYPDNYTFFMDGGHYGKAFNRQTVKHDMAGITKATKAENPDIALFQEVDTDGDRSRHVNEVKWLEQGLTGFSNLFAQNYDSPYFFYPLYDPIGKAKSGILTLAQAKLTDSRRYQLPIDTNFSKFFDLDRAISITHLPVKNSRQLAVINVHMSAFTSNQAVRKAQLNKLFAKMKQEIKAGNYVMVGGDYNHDMLGNSPELFNTSKKRLNWTHAFPLNELPQGFRYADNGLRTKRIPSVRNNNMPYQADKTYVSFTDGFIVSDNIKVDRVHVKNLQFAYADHDPVIMNFSLK